MLLAWMKVITEEMQIWKIMVLDIKSIKVGSSDLLHAAVFQNVTLCTLWIFLKVIFWKATYHIAEATTASLNYIYNFTLSILSKETERN